MRLRSLVVAILALLSSGTIFALDYDQGFGSFVNEQAVRNYTMECAGCHGSDAGGRNGMAPNFREEWSRLTKSDTELLRNLHTGYKSSVKFYSGGACPSTQLPDDELVDIIAVMRQFVGQ